MQGVETRKSGPQLPLLCVGAVRLADPAPVVCQQNGRAVFWLEEHGENETLATITCTAGAEDNCPRPGLNRHVRSNYHTVVKLSRHYLRLSGTFL